jgi:cytochrome c-type biogenesis protein CcmH
MKPEQPGRAPTRGAAPPDVPARVSRRQFLTALGAGAATSLATGLALSPLGAPMGHHVHAQEAAQPGVDGALMDQSAAKSVRRPAKPGATPQLSNEQRDDLEHRIKCQCGCTLDVYTCRTTDFSCQVSPAMHRDVLSLVEGGYTADEILAAFTETYGQKVLMAPRREGFNLAGYWMPFAALGTGGVVVAALIRRWGRRAAEVNAAARADLAHVGANGSAPSSAPWAGDATPDELARLEAAVRSEDDR